MKDAESHHDANQLNDAARESSQVAKDKSDLSQILVTDPASTSSIFKQMHSSGRDLSASSSLSRSESHLELAAAGPSLLGSISVPGARELVRFKEALPSSDLPATARDVKERVGEYVIKPGESALPPTLEFENESVSLSDKLRTALVEMQARDERAFYILHKGDQIEIKKSDSPDRVLQRYAELQERRTAAGVQYSVREIGLGVNSISFPNGVDHDKAIKATIAEAQARRCSLSLSLDGAYIGIVDSKLNYDAVKRTYDAAQKHNKDAESARKSAVESAASLRAELGYSIKASSLGNGLELQLNRLPGDSKLDSVIDAAMAEARAEGKYVSIKVGDESYTSVGPAAVRDRKVAEFRKAIDRAEAQNEARSFREKIGYQFAKNSNSGNKNADILFPANCSPEDRIKAALSEAKALDRQVNFTYDGVKMTVAPNADLEQAQRDYMARWKSHRAQFGETNLQSQGQDLARLGYRVDNLKSEYSKDGEIVFPKSTSLSDKVQASITEARARNQGLYFEDEGHRLFVSGKENPVEKLAQLEKVKERAAATEYKISELSARSVGLNFKPGTPANEIAKATIAERDARQEATGRPSEISFTIGGKYGGSLSDSVSVAKLTSSIEAKDREWAARDLAQQALESKAQVFRDQFNYQISKGEFNSYEMKVDANVPLEKAAEAAIAEAKAKSSPVAMSKDGVTTYVYGEDSPQDVLRSYSNRKEAAAWRSTADELKTRLGYEVGIDKLQPKLQFPPDTTAEDRVNAALAEAKARQQNVSFTYDDVRTTISPSDNFAEANNRYLEHYGKYKQEQAAKLAQHKSELSGTIPNVDRDLPKLRMADVSRIVQDFGHTGDSIENRFAFIAAVHDSKARENFLRGARNDAERRAFSDLLDKAGAMPPDEFAAFKENLNANGEGRSGMSTAGKVGAAVGLLALVSAGLYFAQEKYRQSKADAEVKSHEEKKVPFFKSE